MNYRHAFHAGNFADVFKHIILARIVSYLQRKEKGFRIYDTHSGPGFYDLSSEQAGKTGEWLEGLKRIQDAHIPGPILELLSPWLDAVDAATEGYYPGSPKIARYLMRKQDRLSLYELHKEDFAALQTLFKGDFQTKTFNLDGWYAAKAHTPPKEGRGMMLVDPPYEDGDDFNRMVELLETISKRWSGGTVALWYPVKRRSHTDDWLETIEQMRLPDVLNAEIYIQEPRMATRLNGCGMVILNPPYTLEKELRTLLPWLSDILSQGRGSGHRLRSLGA